MGDTWTIQSILAWIEGYLAEHGDESPRASAQWLVSEALGVSRMQLFLDLHRPLTLEERDVLRDYTRRRGAGEPLQYITGEAPFRHITVKVRPGVLIPRPETEVLVSEALALLPAPRKPQDDLDDELIAQYRELMDENEAAATADAADPTHADEGELGSVHGEQGEAHNAQGSSAHGEQGEAHNAGELLVADICTGTGCIACSLAAEHPRTQIIATDIAPEAVQLARENVANLGLEERVQVLQSDLGAAIDPALKGRFDLIISNPPYVPTAVLAQIPREVADHEPELALDGGQDGLDIFRRLLPFCAEALKPGGVFAFELHETCLQAAADEAARHSFCDIRIIEDLAGKPRILTGRK